MEKRELKHGDIVQIDPSHDDRFGGCFMMVTEPKPWGAQGFVGIPASPAPSSAFYRCPFESMEFIGHAVWAPAPHEDE